MKGRRRHELQENELAKVIKKAPTFWQEFGGRGLLFAVAILAIALLIRYRISSSRAATASAVENLNNARESISQLQNSVRFQLPPLELATQRRTIFSDAGQALEQATNLADDAKLQAEAHLARGDLNWTLANLPELPGAATQPSLKIARDPAELLKAAEDAYQTVLSKYADQQHAAIAAHFGLAAIAENRSQWDAAKKEYEAVATMKNVPQAYLEQARIRLQKLPELQQPVTIAAPATMPNWAALQAAASTMPSSPLPPGIAAPTTLSATKPSPPGVAPAPVKPPATAPKPSPTTAPATSPAR